MKYFIQHLIIPIIIIAPVFAHAQCMLMPVSLEERVSNSSLIIEGKVVGQSSFWKDKNIYTDNRIEVYSILKGMSDSGYVHLLTEGGTVGEITEDVTALLTLGKGETGVFICQKTADRNYFTSYASAQGFIKYDRLNATANDFFNTYPSIKEALLPAISKIANENVRIIRPFPQIKPVDARTNIAPVITGFTPDTINAGVGDILTINGSGFGTRKPDTSSTSPYVLFPNADNGGKTTVTPFLSQYISWTDTQIQLHMASSLLGNATTPKQCAGGGQIKVVVNNITSISSKSLEIKYAQINFIHNGNIQQAYLAATASTGGYLFSLNANFDTIAKSAVKTAFIRSFDKWRCSSQINWTLSQTNTSIDSAGYDGKNIISFDTPAQSLPAGVLGSTQSFYTYCTEGVYISEIDMRFARGYKWSYDSLTTVKSGNSKIDFESVMLHELGHAQQLAHNNDINNLMYWALSPGKVKNAIDNGSLDGAKTIINYSSQKAVCGSSSISLLPASYCNKPYNGLKSSDEIVATPNPFFRSSSINYSLSKQQLVIMQLFDSYGNFSGEIMKKTLDAGDYRYDIDFGSKSNGLYILKTIIGDKVITTKLFNL